VIRVDGEIIRREQFDAVSVRIADVEKERVGNAVTARAAFHVGKIA
jgi:hypothetical protein